MEIDRQQKAELLQRTIKHIDITAHDTARADRRLPGDVVQRARARPRLRDLRAHAAGPATAPIILTVAGSTSAAGCMQVYVDLVRHNMVDVVVATGATIVDMDFFEALGFAHYRGSQFVDDGMLREHYIDRIYDTYIDEDELQHCDRTIKEIADALRAAALLLARVHPRDGPLAGGQPGARASSPTRSCRPPTSTTCRSSARRSPTAARASAWSPIRSERPDAPSDASIRCATSAS